MILKSVRDKNLLAQAALMGSLEIWEVLSEELMELGLLQEVRHEGDHVTVLL